MKKILLAAAAVALFSAPAFAAPEPYNVEVGMGGTFRVSPPTAEAQPATTMARGTRASMEQAPSSEQQASGSWSRANAPSTSNNRGQVIQASDEQGAAPVMSKKKKHHKHGKKDATAPAAPKNSAEQPADQSAE